MKLGQNVCLDVTLDELENGSCRVKNYVTRPNLIKTLLINATPHNPEASGERIQGQHGCLVLRKLSIKTRMHKTCSLLNP